MSLITKARPAAPLALTDTVQIIADAGNPKAPCTLGVSGSSNFQLRLFNVTATGFTTPNQAGRLTLVLFGLPNAVNAPAPSLDPSTWTQLASTPPEPVGRAQDPASTQWMMQGTRLMYYLGSGKLQGESLSNIADNPVPAEGIESLLGLKANVDPVCVFAIGAYFTPEEDPIT